MQGIDADFGTQAYGQRHVRYLRGLRAISGKFSVCSSLRLCVSAVQNLAELLAFFLQIIINEGFGALVKT